MAAAKFNMVRLAELRDSHAALVEDYQRSVRAVSDAAIEASRARLDAPALPGAAPTPRLAAVPPGIGAPLKTSKPRNYTNEFYLLPLTTILGFTESQLDEAGVDQRAVSKIIVAQNRLAKLRTAHALKGAAVRQSADAMKHINIFAIEKRL